MSKADYWSLNEEKYTALVNYGRHITRPALEYDINTMRPGRTQEIVGARILGHCKSCGAPDDGADDCSYCKMPRLK